MRSEKIEYGLKNKKLKLTALEKIQHYGIVGFCLVLPLTFIFIQLKDYYQNKFTPLKSGEILLIVIPLLIGILFFYLQKGKLKFKEVNTSLKKEELNEIIEIN